MATSSTTNPIQNIVVLMLENRSYDNVLGWLYGAGNAAPYDKPPSGQTGLNGLAARMHNPNPYEQGKSVPVGNQTTPTQIPGQPQTYPATTIPVVDPQEKFEDMAQQYTGSVKVPTANPYTDGPPSGAHAMKGFTLNYAERSHVTSVNVADVMNYFTPAQLPVTAFLANQFAVCDSWYASAPTHTFCNRVFGHCAAPGTDPDVSLVDDTQYLIPVIRGTLVDLPSVFSVLDGTMKPPAGGGPCWRLYFHDYSISIALLPYLSAIAGSITNNNLCTFSTADWGSGGIPSQLKSNPSNFLADVANGTLPPYSFIEPRYTDTVGSASPLPSSNCNHPGATDFLTLFGVTDSDSPIDMSSGELLLMQVYNALRGSAYWDTTLLIITYDEAGGLFDHEPPQTLPEPGAVMWGNKKVQPYVKIPPASDIADKASDGFDFNVSGGRVPTIIVSKYVQPGSTLPVPANSQVFDHASLVRTVLDAFCATNTHLNDRDEHAPSALLAVCTSTTNDALAFSGVIVTAPSSLTFRLALLEDSGVKLILADAGGPALSVSSAASWLTTTVDNTVSPAAITVTANRHGLGDQMYVSALTISGNGLPDVVIPVTLFSRAV